MSSIEHYAAIVVAKQKQLAILEAALEAEFASYEQVGGSRRELKLAVRGIRISRAKVKHGNAFAGRATSEYKIWNSMKNRATSPENAAWKDYGGRGIGLCERWHQFENFLADMGKRPSPDHSLDRINNDGPYDPSNCRWATRQQQARNRRSSHFIEWNGETKTLAEWAEVTGISYGALMQRLANGWSVERALTTPWVKKWSKKS